ncbi:MAG: hypothetical protein AAF297_07475 [Planctomycetota bacterium]
MFQPPARCVLDDSIDRVQVGDMKFPLGVYPVEETTPIQGYSVEFEPADGVDDDEAAREAFGDAEFPATPAEPDDSGMPDPFDAADWERWPDRYVYDVVLTCERVPALVRHLISLMPGRIFPILDFIGHDAFREVDPYISYSPLGVDRFMDAIRRYRPCLFEDGLCGFGVMSDDPFLYVFVDEHKIVTIRAEPDQRERVERVLEAFDLTRVENPAGADAATHEHRGVLLTPDDKPGLLSAEEIVEHLRDEWRLTLNIDPDTNVDDQGRHLGLTAWRCLLRCQKVDAGRAQFAEVVLYADCLAQAEELSFDAVTGLMSSEDQTWLEPVLLAADRATPEQVKDLLRAGRTTDEPAADPKASGPRVARARMLE